MTNTETTKATLVNLDNLKGRKNHYKDTFIVPHNRNLEGKTCSEMKRRTVSIYILGSIFAGFISLAKQINSALYMYV